MNRSEEWWQSLETPRTPARTRDRLTIGRVRALETQPEVRALVEKMLHPYGWEKGALQKFCKQAADALLAAYRDRDRWKADAARLLVERHEQVHAERWAKCQAEAALVVAEREVERLHDEIRGVLERVATNNGWYERLVALAASREGQDERQVKGR